MVLYTEMSGRETSGRESCRTSGGLWRCLHGVGTRATSTVEPRRTYLIHTYITVNFFINQDSRTHFHCFISIQNIRFKQAPKIGYHNKAEGAPTWRLHILCMHELRLRNLLLHKSLLNRLQLHPQLRLEKGKRSVFI